MTEETKLFKQCGIPNCGNQSHDDYPICKDHLDIGYLPDYQEYISLIEEGHTRYAAGVMAGLRDPDH